MRRSREILLVVVLAIAFAGPARADTSTLRPVWSFTRGHSASAFDTRRQRLIVLGGRGGTDQALVEVLDLSGVPEWQRQATSGTQVGNFDTGTAVYDSLRDRVLLFIPGSNGFFCLSLAAPMTWSEITPTGSPVFRSGMMVAYDRARDRVIGHGGTASPASVNDTWVLTLGATPAWSLLPTAGGAPPTRTDGVAAWDGEGDRLLVFGGSTVDAAGSYTERNDVWQLTFAGGIPTWNPLATTGGPPQARRAANAAFDRLDRRLVVNGGVVNGAAGDGTTWTLELTGAPHWVPGPPPGPPGRYAAAAAYDPIAQRMVIAGGGAPEFGDTWELPLTPTPGAWAELLAVGGAPSGVAFAGYDAAAHRFAGLTGAVPTYLSMDDSTWHPVGSHPASMNGGLGLFYDPGTNTFYRATVTDLYTFAPGAAGVWTQTEIIGVNPPPMSPGIQFFDRKRGRFLLIGGYQPGSGGFTSTGFWTLTLGTPPIWSKIADATVLGARVTPPIEDLRRDRLLFFGGGQLNPLAPPQPIGDLQELDLGTLTFRTPQAGGTPPPPLTIPLAAYDSTRDRAIVCAGGVYYLQFGPTDADGAWVRNDPVGKIPSGITNGLATVDIERDVLYIADPTRIYEIRWDQGLPGFKITPPAPAVWTPGSILPLVFTGTQSLNSAQSYAWEVRSPRAWPGFPLQGFQAFPGAGSIPISVGIPVPDSAAAGTDTLSFVIRAATNSGLADSCRVVIGDVTSHVLWEFVDLVMDPVSANLTWLVDDTSQTRARIDRRTPTSDWVHVGDVNVSRGVVQFRDPDIAPGGRYGYRAGILVGSSYMWSDSTWIDIPAAPTAPPARLAFASDGAIVVQGPLKVTFALPANDPARLDVLDLNGRLVAEGQAEGAAVHTQTLAAAGQLHPGIYFVRLRQNGAEVTMRAVVLGGR